MPNSIKSSLPRSLKNRYSDVPQLTLNVDKSKITELLVKEGTFQFGFWFVVSTYLPILTACMCPLTNMLSIAALVSKWRIEESSGKLLRDTESVYSLNSCSLALGCIANLSVFFNFGRRMNYKVSQVISITFFFMASVFLLSATLVANHTYFSQSVISYKKSEGFWFAVVTTVLYFICFCLCLLNFSGYLLKKYPPDFNLGSSERGLVIYTFMLAIWFSWGAGMFSRLLNVTYGDALYFCCVSLLTIGLGDLVPTTDAGKALTLLYSLTGIILMGLIIAMLRAMASSSTTPVLFWNTLEKNRRAVLAKVQEKNLQLSQEDSFDLIRSLRRSAKTHQRNISSLVTLSVFVGFWLIGALVFKFTEDWRYFDSLYFCFLCLITIGFGDFTPKSAAGRVWFIVWSLGAVPLMTALISNVGDSVYQLAMSGVSLSVVKQLFSRKRDKATKELLEGPPVNIDDENAENDDSESEDLRSTDEIIEDVERKQKAEKAHKVKSVVENLRTFIVEAKDLPDKKYGYSQWKMVLDLLELEDKELEQLGVDESLFWISDHSPLRYPISEPNYLLYLLFSRLESIVSKISESFDKDAVQETLDSTTQSETVDTK